MDPHGERPCETTEVIICGGGPTGALLSAMLGKMNVPNAVLERESDITSDPRGIALDEEGIRYIQSIGMYDRVYTQIAQCQDVRFLSGSDSDLAKVPFLGFDITSSEGGTGHVGIIFHKQPELERAMRDAIAKSPCSELRPNSTLVGITENGHFVEAEYMDQQGSKRKIRGRFLVGADGKTGHVRKQYLEPRGISMDLCKGKNYDETWVALNWQMRLPTAETHPDFPLWQLGYSPEDVYDLFFPQDFRFLCNPARAAVCGRFGPPADRLWRFEFVIKPGEDPNTMASQSETFKIILPYLTHPGRRYGLQTAVQYPLDCITIRRSRPFHFSARSCNKWALGRIILVGDAAHVFPPFGGQGIASGFRDAAGLAWRLALLHREPEADHEQILRGWFTERKQQFERSLLTTIQNGELLTNSSWWKAFVRDWTLWLLQLSPSIRQYVRRGPRADGMIRYRWEEGLPFVGELGGGLQIPQVYAKDLLSWQIVFSDDVIFQSSDQGLLRLLILADDFQHASELRDQVEGMSHRTNGRVKEEESTILLHNLEIEKVDLNGKSARVARIATGDEFVYDSTLCRGRPVPKRYDPHRIRQEVGSKIQYVLLRADRFVYAACTNVDELWHALSRLDKLLFVSKSAGLDTMSKL